jgi:hypothetical protein
MAGIDDERLTGLIAYLLACHGGGFVNNTIQRDELLSVLEELQQTACKLGQPFLYIGAEVLIAWILFDRPA